MKKQYYNTFKTKGNDQVIIECYYDSEYAHPQALEHNKRVEEAKLSGSAEAEYVVTLMKLNADTPNEP